MTKRFLIILVMLFLCNTSFAEIIEMNCPVNSRNLKDIKWSDRDRFVNKTISLIVDYDQEKIFNNSKDDSLTILHGIEDSVDLKLGMPPMDLVGFKKSDPNSAEDKTTSERLRQLEALTGVFHYNSQIYFVDSKGKDVTYTYNVTGFSKEGALLEIKIDTHQKKLGGKKKIFELLFSCE